MPEAVLNTGDLRLTYPTIHLVRDTTYILASEININAGQKLVIDAGTLIRVANNVAVNVVAGGSIEVKGSHNNPVVFTSTAPKGSQGFADNNWQGISITASTAPQASIILSYMRVEFCGGRNRDALSFTNVDSTAVLNNIQVSYSQSNSFSFNGGNARAHNLVSYASSLSDYRLSTGYKGLMQNIIAFRHPYFPQISPASFAGLYIDGVNTLPIISNLSVIGPGGQSSASDAYNNNFAAGIFVTNGAKFLIKNSVIIGFIKGALSINNAETARAIEFGPSKLDYSIVQNQDTSRLFYIPLNIYRRYTALNFKNFMLGSNFKNQSLLSTDDFKLTDPFNYDVNPNITPSTGSPLFSGADFQDPFFSNSFFQQVSHRGAIGQQDWQQGWVNYLPLQTNY